MNGKKSRLRKKLTVVALVAGASATVGLTALGTGSAFAGSNGQEIFACQAPGDDFGGFLGVTITGVNQNGEEVTWGLDDVPNIQCIRTIDYFWVGDVSIQWTRSTRFKADQSMICSVPTRQSADVKVCTLPPPPAPPVE